MSAQIELVSCLACWLFVLSCLFPFDISLILRRVLTLLWEKKFFSPQAARLGPLAATSLQTWSSPATTGIDPKSLTKRANFTVLLQMPRRHCKTCRSPLHANDSHAEYVSCLEKSHADAALSGTDCDCSHCESFSLASLLSRIAFFSERDSAPPCRPVFFEAKMLANEEAGLDSVSLRDLRSMTDLALHATKATAQAIGRSMSSLIVLERHI